MDRQPPRTISDEIDLYIRTYYSLLRSSGEVRVRAFEEAHVYSRSSLHTGAQDATPDLAAFAYSAARLPDCMPTTQRLVLGQSVAQFVRAGLSVPDWARVTTRGRRRPLRWDGRGTLAVFVASASDIDDLVPIVTAYQVEWNKMHARLSARAPASAEEAISLLGVDADGLAILRAALGSDWLRQLGTIAARECDLRIRLLDGSYREYQRSARRWWDEIAASALAVREGRHRPVYFVSSNSHALPNLLGGYARTHRDDILAYARASDPEGLAARIEEAVSAGDEQETSALLYYFLRAYLHHGADAERRLDEVQEFDAAGGITSIISPGRIDVNAQVIELSALRPERFDPRVRVPHLERLAASDAVIVNIDYPLGMASYHHLSALAQGVGEIRGVYVMGKAATLNGRVGDVMISKVVYDEHSKNTYLYPNAFAAADVQPLMRYGTVLDNQKALTVRSAFLQNRDYMGVFYREGYTVLEMEAGPYLSALYEMVSPKRHPKDEIVTLLDLVDVDIGVMHYASDTPYSRRQSLLSKSLSYFGVESTYACAIATVRRIFQRELERLDRGGVGALPPSPPRKSAG